MGDERKSPSHFANDGQSVVRLGVEPPLRVTIRSRQLEGLGLAVIIVVGRPL
jgi:hypothetical protein